MFINRLNKAKYKKIATVFTKSTKSNAKTLQDVIGKNISVLNGSYILKIVLLKHLDFNIVQQNKFQAKIIKKLI